MTKTRKKIIILGSIIVLIVILFVILYNYSKGLNQHDIISGYDKDFEIELNKEAGRLDQTPIYYYDVFTRKLIDRANYAIYLKGLKPNQEDDYDLMSDEVLLNDCETLLAIQNRCITTPRRFTKEEKRDNIDMNFKITATLPEKYVNIAKNSFYTLIKNIKNDDLYKEALEKLSLSDDEFYEKYASTVAIRYYISNQYKKELFDYLFEQGFSKAEVDDYYKNYLIDLKGKYVSKTNMG